jgi:hypothetical protein
MIFCLLTRFLCVAMHENNHETQQTTNLHSQRHEKGCDVDAVADPPLHSERASGLRAMYVPELRHAHPKRGLNSRIKVLEACLPGKVLLSSVAPFFHERSLKLTEGFGERYESLEEEVITTLEAAGEIEMSLVGDVSWRLGLGDSQRRTAWKPFTEYISLRAR